MYHNALFKRNADKAAAFVKPLQVRIGYAYALIFTHELTDGSCIGCDELNVAELIGAEQMVKHFKKIVILIDRERHGAELIKAYAFFARHRVVLIKISHQRLRIQSNEAKVGVALDLGKSVLGNVYDIELIGRLGIKSRENLIY